MMCNYMINGSYVELKYFLNHVFKEQQHMGFVSLRYFHINRPKFWFGCKYFTLNIPEKIINIYTSNETYILPFDDNTELHVVQHG